MQRRPFGLFAMKNGKRSKSHRKIAGSSSFSSGAGTVGRFRSTNGSRCRVHHKNDLLRTSPLGTVLMVIAKSRHSGMVDRSTIALSPATSAYCFAIDSNAHSPCRNMKSLRKDSGVVRTDGDPLTENAADLTKRALRELTSREDY